MNALPGYDHFLSAQYDDMPEIPEPTLGDIQEALDRLVADSGLLCEYITGVCSEPELLPQILYAGLPRDADKSERADGIRDKYQSARNSFFAGYRDWLGERLKNMAQTVANKRVEAARDDY